MNVQDRSDWLTVDAAAARLGVSRATIQRRIQDGKPVKLAGGRSVALETEMIERPQGHEWRVRIIGVLPPISSDHEHHDSEEPPAISSVQDRSDIAHDLLSLNTAQAERIAALERENGRLESDATHAQQLARMERERRLEADKRAATFEQLAAERGRELERERQALADERAKSWWDKLRGR